MAPVTAIHFQPELLRQRYIQNLDDAFRAGSISADERRWLEQLSNLEGDADAAVDLPRVDRLLLEDGSSVGAEMAGALLVSSQDPEVRQVYLDTLLYGLLRFDSRDELLTTVQRLFSDRAVDTQTFERQVLEGDPFEQRMLLMIDQQALHLRQLSQMLLELPSLREALAGSLSDHLRAALSGAPVDLQAPMVLVADSELLKAEQIPLNAIDEVNTLEQTIAADLLGSVRQAGKQRQWLDASGNVMGKEQAEVYQLAFAHTCSTFKAAYAARLEDFWNHPQAQGTTRRNQLAQAYAEGFHQALLNRSEDGTLSADEFRHLAGLLRPVAVRLGLESRSRTSRLAVKLGNQEPFKLAGVFLASAEGWPGVLLYSAVYGLRRFSDLVAVAAHYSSVAGRNELLYYLSANDLLLFNGNEPLSLATYLIDDGLFLDLADSIIALQQRNLAFALNKPHNAFSVHAAMVDDALDIRYLVDSRLLRVNGGGRWLEQEQKLARSWPVPVTTPVPAQLEAMRDLLKTRDPALMSWADQLAALETLARFRLDHYPDLVDHASAVLNGYLAVLGTEVPYAQDIVVQWGGDEMDGRTVRSTPVPENIALPDLLLERVVGLRDAQMPAGSQILRRDQNDRTLQAEPRLTPGLIDHVTACIASGFVADYSALMRSFAERALRMPERRLEPETLGAQILGELLSLDSVVLERSGFPTANILQMLGQALTRPVASLRQVFGDDRVEVCLLSLSCDGRPTPLSMSNAFFLRQPGRNDGYGVLWSAVDGLDLVGSESVLQEKINERLSSGDNQDRRLSLFSQADQDILLTYLRQPGRSPLRVNLVPFDGNFIRQLWRNEQARQTANIDLALARAMQSRLPAALFNRFVANVRRDDKLSLVFDLLSSEIQDLTYTVQLLDWLDKATLDELVYYVRILERYYLSNNPAQDFLAGIPRLKNFASEELKKQFGLDFPDAVINPADITVKLTRYVPSPVATGEIPSGIAAVTQVYQEGLPLFALNHFSEFHNGTLSLEFAPNTPVPQGLTSDYIDALVRNLDLGLRYQTLLTDRLAVSDVSYPLRRERFIAQTPARMLIVALEMKMQGRLSAAAYDYIEGVLDMPDGIARQPVRDQEITLRPLQLLPRADMAADTVAGVYLIGPKDWSQGPLVLHALFNHAFSFKEYRDQAHFLAELRASEPLQTLVLGRLEPLLVKRYSHGGFSEAHIPWSTESSLDVPVSEPELVALADTPVLGNALHYLFLETLSVFKAMACKQTVTSAQADWEAFVYLMALGAEQILMFAPGKLGLLVAALQSKGLFEASLDAAYDQQWGKALSELSAALSGVVAFRSSQEEIKGSGPELVAREQVIPELPIFSWRNSQLTPELKIRLRAFEVHDVALNTLDRDPLLNVYQDPATQRRYAAVAGQVYQVQFAERRWSIVHGLKKGPPIKLNAQQHWEMDLKWGLLGGGGTVSRIRASSLTPSTVEEVFIAEAYGMREIRSVARYKARMISEAHQLAVTYLESCLANLNPETGLDAATDEVLADFFGVEAVTEELLTEVRESVTTLFEAVSDPSLDPYRSRRFVIGHNRPGHEDVKAFVVRNDALRRIYLTEQYFAIPSHNLNKRVFPTAGFNTGTHFRAATLLHELSHMVLSTHDIAYLDASAPFPDLLGDGDLYRMMLKRDLERLRSHGFSHRTPSDELFTTLEGHVWRDFIDDDGAELATVLEVTAQATLLRARAVFLADPVKRRQLILKNADSVALLVTMLGRHRHAI